MSRVRLFVAAAAVALPCLSYATGMVVTVRAQAEVTGATVRLGDIAELSGDGAARAAQLQVFAAPRVGVRVRVPLLDIKAGTRQQGIAHQDIEWRGATFIEVMRTGQAIDQDALRQAALLAAGQVYGKGTVVELDDRLPAALQVPVGAVTFKPRTLANEKLGARMNVWIDVLVDGANYRSVVVPVNASREGQVFAARRDIAAGQVIDADDVVAQQTNTLALRAAPVTTLSIRAARNIRAGDVITQDYVASPKAVLAGDRVRLIATSQGMNVETEAIVRKGGMPGDTITLATPDGRGTVTATLTSPGVARLQLQ